MDNIKYAIEGILFAAGEPVKAAKLAVVLDTSVDEVNKAVDELKKEYSENHRGFNIIDILEGYQICLEKIANSFLWMHHVVLLLIKN